MCRSPRVAGASYDDRAWRAGATSFASSAAQTKLGKLPTNSIHRTAHGATHAALLEDKRFAAITSRAILQVVRAAK